MKFCLLVISTPVSSSRPRELIGHAIALVAAATSVVVVIWRNGPLPYSIALTGFGSMTYLRFGIRDLLWAMVVIG
jgi:hypothetical protein